MKLIKLEVGEYQENCYIVSGSDSSSAIVIDPGAEVEKIIDALRQSDLLLCYIILTHGHPDHCGALRALKDISGAPVAMHPADIPSLNDTMLKHLLGMHGVTPTPDELLYDGDVVRQAGIELKVMHTPGHTPGGLCFLGDGCIFSGDSLFNGSIGRTDLPGGSHHQLVRALREVILPLPDETKVYPGHGPDTTIGAERRGNPFLQGD